MKKFLFLILSFGLIISCSKNPTDSSNNNNTQQSQGVPVKMQAQLEKGTGVGIGKLSSISGGAVDSVKVDTAMIVLKSIEFKLDVDTVKIDSTDDPEDKIKFKGPFFITIRSGEPVDIGVDSIPPGNYKGIKFKIHKIKKDTLTFKKNRSVYVTGKVWEKGSTTPKRFEFSADINEEFKVKGNFTVNAGEKGIPYVLVFDLKTWFTKDDGTTLNPLDKNDANEIKKQIKKSLKDNKSGRKGG
jgi:hypothetical protein